MEARTSFRICVVVLAISLWVWHLAPAGAEPPAGCLDLAARFANAAGGLDLRELADLTTCVSVELQERIRGPMVTPAPESPAPPQAPQPTRDVGQWPPSAPWGSPWPSEGPGVR